LKEQGYSPKFHFVWSDGCNGQFKSIRTWYFVFRYLSLTNFDDLLIGCEMINWNCFATNRGKCEVDGIGALLKREVMKEQIKPQGKNCKL
jgi:hypothetical protein